MNTDKKHSLSKKITHSTPGQSTAQQAPFGEIIQSSLQSFMAQSWQWDMFPPFASLIQVASGNRIVYGLVYEVKTGSMDVIRSPFPYKKTEEELLAEQPQIFEFLQTTFSCIPIGYEEKGHMYYVRIPQPPKIHAFTSFAPDEKRKIFLSNPQYLHTIFGAAALIGCPDELILGLLSQQKTLSTASLQALMKQYTLLTGNDYRRIKLFLQRVQDLPGSFGIQDQ